LVSHHDAFNYFCTLYGFAAASPGGWSTGDEIGAGITAERRQKVVDSIRSYNVKAIFVETTINPKLVRQIAADAGVTVAGSLYADSMGGPGTAAESYLGMMRENVILIVNGLK
jgi:manganese/iron transport system substrate-binding protein